METGEMYYNGQDYQKVSERLFQINNNIELLCQNVDKFSIRDMARKIIPRNLKTMAHLENLDKASNELHNKDGIIALIRRFS
jgi:hypothetical protein